MSMVILQMQFTKSQISSCPTPKQRCTIHLTFSPLSLSYYSLSLSKRVSFNDYQCPLKISCKPHASTLVPNVFTSPTTATLVKSSTTSVFTTGSTTTTATTTTTTSPTTKMANSPIFPENVSQHFLSLFLLPLGINKLFFRNQNIQFRS